MMPPWVIEIFTSNYEAFAAKPIVFLLALIAGAVIGFIFSKVVHKGTIDGLEQRIKLRDEQIDLKDKAIESMSVDRAKLEQAAIARAPTSFPPATTEARPGKPDSRFATVNAQIIRATEQRMRDLLLGGTFKFVFNPAGGQWKELTFLAGGVIGQGRNKNEDRWRIEDGRLEILNSEGAVYSRFVLLDDNQSLHHTNDPDTRSLRGQYIKRLGTPPTPLQQVLGIKPTER